ncbi:hypothetical protein TrLO_g8480 [Triparma laevis f. longispina]|uniref:Transmembrane protein 234 homolog n=1 Tax=Triparma laevis f. longispina TaxID=1714387 RepID=A0A9W7F405_9STRA|nr:hypothetical protein TrLO_g8480 [Triparma laevis f. longispina]
MFDASTFLKCVAVSLVWGVTNPFINAAAKKAKKGDVIDKGKKILVPYAINQLGSILFYLLLSTNSLIVGPIVNAMTQSFTFLFGFLLFGERYDSWVKVVLGSLLVFVGVGVCTYADVDGGL